MDYIDQWFNEMNSRGIKTVVIEYNGYGDSGNVESVEDHTVKDYPLKLELPDGVENFFLEKISGDWYNNLGGQGIITININKRSWKIKEGYNYTKTSYTTTKGQLGEPNVSPASPRDIVS